jgi:hypothetical protein
MRSIDANNNNKNNNNSDYAAVIEKYRFRSTIISNNSLKHILIDCVDVADVRSKLYDVNTLC